jgi:hypothetical protein
MSALVRLYPRSWRARYEDEFLGLLEARPPTMRDRVDIVRGAIDARRDQRSPNRWERPVRAAAVSAIAAGGLWIAWLVLSVQAFKVAEADPIFGFGRLLATLAGLAAVASHLSLGFASVGRMRGWGGYAAAIAAVGFFITAIGGGAAALFALLGSIGLATAVAGRTVPSIVAVLWVVAVVGVFNAFAALVRTQWTDPSVMFQAIPFGIVWVLVGLTIGLLGMPSAVADGASTGSEG